MSDQDPQKTWEDYYSRKKAQRIGEASGLWLKMATRGVDEDTVMALDFVHIGNELENAKELSDQLSENYEMTISQDQDENYWYVKGTTRPHGITLSKQQHIAWVEFMSEVSQSYSCVFSTWAFEVPSLKESFRSEDIESAS